MPQPPDRPGSPTPINLARRFSRIGYNGPAMLISLHLPKTAGTSFRAALEERFGDGLRRDYGDVPLNTPARRRHARALRDCLLNSGRRFAGVQCIHGHFLPLKYRLLGIRRDVKFVTWLRDPVERLASHYHFWKTYEPPQPTQPLWKKFRDEQWSFEQFGTCAELRNVYCQFLWGFPLERFDFIGITEHFDADIGDFAACFLDRQAAVHRLNVNSQRTESRHVTDPDLRCKIEAYHAQDMVLYRKAVERRCARLAS
jgi:hypothetical protein